MRFQAVLLIFVAAVIAAALAIPAIAEPGRDDPGKFLNDSKRILERLDRLEKALDRVSRMEMDNPRRGPEPGHMRPDNPTHPDMPGMNPDTRNMHPDIPGMNPNMHPDRPGMNRNVHPDMNQPRPGMNMEGMRGGMKMDGMKGGMNMCPMCMKMMEEKMRGMDIPRENAERIARLLLESGMSLSCPHNRGSMPGAEGPGPGFEMNQPPMMDRRGPNQPERGNMRGMNRGFNTTAPGPDMMPGDMRGRGNIRPNVPDPTNVREFLKNNPRLQEYLSKNPEIARKLLERYNERMKGNSNPPDRRDRIDNLLDRILSAAGENNPRGPEMRRPNAPQGPATRSDMRQPNRRGMNNPPERPRAGEPATRPNPRRIAEPPATRPNQPRRVENPRQPNFERNPGVFGEDVVRPNAKRFEDAVNQLEPKYTEKELRSMPIPQFQRIIAAKEKELNQMKALFKNRTNADMKAKKEPPKKAPEKKNPNKKNPDKKNPPKKMNMEEDLDIDGLGIEDESDMDDFFSDEMDRMNEFFYSLETERSARF